MASPITFSEVTNLTKHGVQPASIKFGGVTMESDKFVLVREETGGQKTLVIINLLTGAVQRKNMAAESVIMNPNQQIIALRAGDNAQVFDLASGKKQAAFSLGGAPVKFWTWVTPTIVGIVTDSSVFHWTMGTAAPVKIFDRLPANTSCQVVNYCISPDEKWLLLSGICKGASGQPGDIDGHMQFFSVEKNVSQPLKGFTGSFCMIDARPGSDKAQCFVFVQKVGPGDNKLVVKEIGRDRSAPGGVFSVAPQAIQLENPMDFPVAARASPKHDMHFIITKMGFLYLFDLHSGTCLFKHRIVAEPVFVSCAHTAASGMLGITAGKGQVLSVSLNTSNIVPHIMKMGPQGIALAMDIAGRLNLSGADQLYTQRFEQLLGAGNVKEAAQVAAKSPNGVLRTPATIQRLQSMTGTPPPLLQYFAVILETGKLNKMETLEFARPVLQRNPAVLKKYLDSGKLECCEELGDLVAPIDAELALQIFKQGDAHDRVVQMLSQLGRASELVDYSASSGFRADYLTMIQNMVRQNPQDQEQVAVVEMATKLACNPSGAQIDAGEVVKVLMQYNLIKPSTKFLLEYLKPDRKSDSFLQTQLLKINLMGGAAQVADFIMGTEPAMFTHYDRLEIARLCERARLYQRALEHYTDIEDIKRVMMNSQHIRPEFLVTYVRDHIPREQGLDVMKQLLSNNIRVNLRIVVEMAKKHVEFFRAESLIELFDEFESHEGLFHFLGAIVNESQEPEVHYKYIEAAATLGMQRRDRTFFAEVERVCRDSDYYPAEKVKAFLISIKLPEPRPLIHVCDKNGYVDEMTEYLYNNSLLKYIQVYATKVSPHKTPQVIGKLLDLNCDEDWIVSLLRAVRGGCLPEDLVDVCEARNKLPLLSSWLDDRVGEGNQDVGLHNAVGKINVSLNKNDPQKWLLENPFYDSKVVGEYCEKVDPYLAYLAYRRAWGKCDDELIAVTNSNGLFKDQARYLVERMNEELWGKVLDDENQHKPELVKVVISTALPEAEDADMVSCTVKAFMAADDMLPALIDLLERLVLYGKNFANSKNLQNLLILTAIKAAPDRVADFVHRLDKFDGPEIAELAASDEYQLYDEAILIYKKFANMDSQTEDQKLAHNVAAITVMLEQQQDIDAASEFASRVNIPDVWSRLGNAQLQIDDLVKSSMESYIKANDAEMYVQVIERAESLKLFDDLITYLLMARVIVHVALVDTELVFCYAVTSRMSDLETFVAAPNKAAIQDVGDKCFELHTKEMYEAAVVLFNAISNNTKLAVCYVRLERFREAVESATKAASIHTWKEVCAACVKAGEYRLAQTCGMHIVKSPDHLEDLISMYECYGEYDHMIELFERALQEQESVHPGIYTQLAIAYSKYDEEKLMPHLEQYWQKMHVPHVLEACIDSRQWVEARFLYAESGEHGAAIRIMIEHSAVAFDHDVFLKIVAEVRNHELFYTAISFYCEEQPMELGALLNLLIPKLDHTRVVLQMKRADLVTLVLPYLKKVQREDIDAVNTAIHDIYVEEENYEDLFKSIEAYSNYDMIDLAQQIQGHELLEFRRIAAHIYKKKGRFEESVELSKADQMYKDAIDTAAVSKSKPLANDLLRFFVNENDSESFCAMLYTCYDLVAPDTAIELAWRHNLTNFAMPYVVNYVAELEKRLHDLENAKPKKKEAVDDFQPENPMMVGGGPMMIANTAFNTGVPGMQTGVPAMGMDAMGPMGMGPGMSPVMPMAPQGMAAMDPSMGMMPGMMSAGMMPGMNMGGSMPQMAMGMDALNQMPGGSF
jgi:clathrin heavy chain